MTGKQKGFWRAANWAEPTAKKWERKWGCEERERERCRGLKVRNGEILYRMADTRMILAKSNESYLADGSGVGDADGSELGLALSVGVALGLDDGARDGAGVTGAASMKNHAHSLAVSVLPSAKISHRASSVPAPSRNRTTS